MCRLVNSDQYRAPTGREPPPSPVSAASYPEYALPRFEPYHEEAAADIAAAERPAGIERPGEDERALAIDPWQVRRIEPGAGPAQREAPVADPRGRGSR